MFIDYRHYDAPADLKCDICIVGAGAAGITLALALADSGIDVCVLEGGGFEMADESQSLYDGESVGMENASPVDCRQRFFGGTTNRWMGWCAPLQEVDFEVRPWVQDSGWPLSLSDLERYYVHARELCQIPPAGGEAQRVPPEPAFDPEKLTAKYWNFSPPTRFGTVYRDSLASAARVAVYLNCNVYKIDTNAAATDVKTLRIRTLDGKTGTVTAKVYVLACGGMENTRLLLLTNDIERAGLGNRSGTLGTNFRQHIEGVVARVMSPDCAGIADAFAQCDGDGGPLRAHVAISPEAQRERGLLNTGFAISAHHDYSDGYKAMREFRHDVRTGNWSDDLGAKVWSVVTDLGGVAGDAFGDDAGSVKYLDLDVKAEQAPNAASTISLGKNLDAFGLPQIRINWQLSAFDKQSIVGSVQTVAEELGRLNLGRLQLVDWLQPDHPWPDHLWGGCHHIGTTRMSHDDATGIVNADCRMHRVGNLFIAGSSVFPTGGYVPPTLTIVALALRLAEHLQKHYA